VSANDPDCQGGNQNRVRYRLDNSSASQSFTVETTSGKICVNQPLDFETKPSHEFAVYAKDSGVLAILFSLQNNKKQSFS
jgi:hypothetical protein